MIAYGFSRRRRDVCISHHPNNMIYVDVSAAVHSRAGLGRYSERLAQSLYALDPHRFGLFYNQGKGAQLPASLAHMPSRSVQWGYKPWRMAVLLAHLGKRGFNRLVPHVDLYHSTEHLLMPLHDTPTVLTIHDLIFNLFPAYHKKLNYWYLNWAVPIYCRRATRIIAVSEASKRDVVAQYGIDENKITVVYEASADFFQPPTPAQIAHARQTYNLPDQFLLHISTIEPRKNLQRLVDALKIARRDHPHLHLLLIGSKGWLYDDFFAKVANEGLQDVVRPLGWIPDHDLPAIIGAASLAVQPSLYEGFGLPILEHMTCGQVVAASQTSSHPEVGGEAAAYFDPENVAQMATVITHLLHDRAEYAHRRALGLTQAARFSWQRTAQETLAIYDDIL